MMYSSEQPEVGELLSLYIRPRSVPSRDTVPILYQKTATPHAHGDMVEVLSFWYQIRGFIVEVLFLP